LLRNEDGISRQAEEAASYLDIRRAQEIILMVLFPGAIDAAYVN